MDRHLSPRRRLPARAHRPATLAAAVALTLTLTLALSASRTLFGADGCPDGAAETATLPTPVTVAGADLEVVESKGSYESQGKTITVERYEPKATGRYPAVLVIHGAGGMTIGGPWFRDSARMLARRGYVAHVVHYFDLTGTRVADLPTMRANFPAWMRALADGITSASKQPNVDPSRVGLLGFSLGSYLSLSLSMFDHRVLAVVEYFGGLPDELVKDVKTLPPTLILHGDADLVVPVSEAKELQALCREKVVAHEVCIYPGQGHGFTGDPNRDASRRTLAFFETHVKKAGPAPRRATASVPDFERFLGAVEKSGAAVESR
jgi:carboxymethylenebutenolidase